MNGRIIIDSNILGGEPVFEGTRLAVRNIKQLLNRGVDVSEIQKDYPYLGPDDFKAAIQYVFVERSTDMKVRIESITAESKYHDYGFEVTRVYVDDKLIGEGSYNGEIEDRFRCRDFSWVEPLLKTLAEKLGAEVEIKQVEMTEKEYYGE